MATGGRWAISPASTSCPKLHRSTPWGRATRWLTVLTVDPARFGATCEDIRLALERENMESRPLWKPMHMQPVFAGCERVSGGVAEAFFCDGLCLTSGSSMEEGDLARVVGVIAGLAGPPPTRLSERSR